MKRALWETLCGLLLGLLLGAAVVYAAGENPITVAKILWTSAFGTRYDLGLTLFYTTPLIFTGLSVAVSFHAGLFNIGAEGQLTLAALTAAIIGASFPAVPWPLAPVIAILGAVLVGAFWGFIPGLLRAYRGSHEVINTIMLNFIAAALSSWVALSYFQNPNTQNPETRDIGSGYLIRPHDPLANFFGEAPVGIAFIVALMVAVGMHFLLYGSRIGLHLRLVGESEASAGYSGVRAKFVRTLALTISGALAAGVALGEVLGHAGRFRMGFSADYGFIGIAVALLARNQPLAIIATSILFAALHKGAASLDLETENITRDLSVVLQALIILSVSAVGFWSWQRRKK